MRHTLSRREFFKLSAGAGLAIGVSVSGCGREGANPASTRGFVPNIWVRIAPDNLVTVTIAESEMGQGVFTQLAMMVAEELEADWGQMRAEHALADPKYGNQSTGGSTSLRNNWDILRKAGAAAREVLRQAAANKWDVALDQCRAEAGQVQNLKTGERIPYGGLVELAKDIHLPETVTLKDPKDFRILGHPMPRLDTPGKVNGSAVYGSDVALEGLLTATTVHPPVFGARPGKIDDTAALRVSGVRAVLKIDNAVAVVAEDFWSAKQGAGALKVEWTGGDASLDSAGLSKQMRQTLAGPLDTQRAEGDADGVIAKSGRVIEAEYELPFQAHGTMEPMTCTAHVQGDRCEVWAPTQTPTRSQDTAATLTQSRVMRGVRKVLGLNNRDTIIHTTMLGGGFGRRLQIDFVSEAVQISMAMKAPIRLIWTREEDIQHDFYRPACVIRLAAALDTKGYPVAWRHRGAGPKLRYSGAEWLAYDIPNLKVEGKRISSPVPTGPWRSVSHSYNAFAVESFIDELAAAGGHDPLAYRQKLTRHKPKYQEVLKAVADKAGWGKPLPADHYHGLAMHKGFGSYVAQIAEISIDNGKVRVHRVTAAINCGKVVNPDTVRQQMESAITFGLSATLKGKVTLRDGRVEQSNFHDFPILRFDEMPQIDTIIINSGDSPEGVGEPGVPSIGPAVANAVFAATGKRIRTLPLGIV